MWGSSPLARGLHAHCLRQHVGRRIIPARAGFTRRSSGQGQAAADHPRSRGVYGLWTSRSGKTAGSSPLARGLPQAPSHGRGVRGIIPARAGFTSAPRSSLKCRPDHPRSRGVYPSSAMARRRPWGSSPLARGLLRRPLDEERVAGIIPARAGFTAALHGECFQEGDHPRSRGVYLETIPMMSVHAGSSPLARGLRSRRSTPRRRDRIIPARAGFTDMAESAFWRAWDHPRSRGVYGR